MGAALFLNAKNPDAEEEAGRIGEPVVCLDEPGVLGCKKDGRARKQTCCGVRRHRNGVTALEQKVRAVLSRPLRAGRRKMRMRFMATGLRGTTSIRVQRTCQQRANRNYGQQQQIRQQ